MLNKNKGPVCECLHQLGDHSNLRYGNLLDTETTPSIDYLTERNIEAVWHGDKCNNCECTHFLITFNQDKLIKANSN